MKQLFIIVFLLVLFIKTNYADTYSFPPGEIPSMSLLEAAQMCETMAADAGIGKFIPTFGNLVADKERGAEPVSGAWVFRQFTKDRRKYKFNIAFTENTATLVRLMDNSGEIDHDIVLATYRIEGRKLIRLPVPPPPPADTDDPFADKPTPGHPNPGSNKDGKFVPAASDPATSPSNDNPNKPTGDKLLPNSHPQPQPHTTP